MLAYLDSLRFYLTLEVLRPLPLPFILKALERIAAVQHAIHPGARRKAAAWLEASVPGDPRLAARDAMVAEMFRNAAYRRYLNYLLMQRDAREHAALLQVTGWEHVEAALAAGKGVMLLSSKVGLPRLLRWHLRTCPLEVLYLLRIPTEQGIPPWRSRFRSWHNRRFGIHRDNFGGDEELSVAYMKRAVQHLRRNGAVNISGDGQAGEQRYPVEILGREHTFAAGGLAIALAAGSPVLPCFGRIESTTQFHLSIEDPLTIPDSKRPSQFRAMTQEYAGRIERFSREHPTNVVFPRYSLALPA